MCRLMVNLKTTSLVERRTLAATCSLLLLLTLTGCPGDVSSGNASTGSAPAHTTAPTLQQQATHQAQTPAQT